METNLLNSITEPEISEDAQSNLSSIAQWATLNSIIGLVSLVISLIMAFITFSKTSALVGSTNATSSLIGSLIGAGISLLLNLTLLAAAKNMKNGIADSDQGTFTLGVSKLNSYFKIMGILTIIGLIIFTLVLLVAIAGFAG